MSCGRVPLFAGISSKLFLKPSLGKYCGLSGSITLTPSAMKQYGYISGAAGPRVAVQSPV